MPVFNQASSGQKIRVNFNQDISSNTKLEMILEPQAGGNSSTITPTLGTSTIVVDDETYTANQYTEYAILAATFTDATAGKWRKKSIATLPSETVSTNYTFFRVMP